MGVRRTLPLLLALLALAPAAAAGAAVSPKKAVAGPVESAGESVFPTYRDLGAGIYLATLDWAQIAGLPPERARDPEDPSYDWPPDLDEAVDQARQAHMQVALTLTGAPEWANGDHPARYVPKQPSDYADFAVAAARRYPGVHLWIAWHDPSRSANLAPASPGRYAKLLDAAYGALKSASAKNRVAGGNSYTSAAKRWLKGLKLPGGKRPRMDFYGHDPHSSLAALPRLQRWVKQYLGKPLPLFLTGYTTTSAKQLTAAYKRVAKTKSVYTLAFADASALIDGTGEHTPLFAAFKRG